MTDDWGLGIGDWGVIGIVDLGIEAES